ncbi:MULTISPECIES: ergothioneine biosynthesis protein EgtC [Spirulina sp. CCY15215]|uniref:ergothioneine biosynthesis protein EgtC n=1 Tax=Spirulina sp. CCY15215 TaxID=2767591 RepID=UPI00194DE4F7|nr:ergothioneine biosynthesis protein EgtC [Spirulina major]
MCRLLGYLGVPIQLDRLLYKPEHSLIVQSYQPQEMHVALLNADGFGVGWYHPQREENPYTYKNILPIWNDINLPQLSRYVESNSILSYVRSATPGLAVDLGNCQPFVRDRLMFVHNGYIEHFRHKLRRTLCNLLSDEAEIWIKGNTDSEYLCALILTYLEANPNMTLEEALAQAVNKVGELCKRQNLKFIAATIIDTGNRLIACRYSTFEDVPTLYWLRDDPNYPDAVILASEPLFEGNWKPCLEHHILTVEENLEVNISPF